MSWRLASRHCPVAAEKVLGSSQSKSGKSPVYQSTVYTTSSLRALDDELLRLNAVFGAQLQLIHTGRQSAYIDAFSKGARG